MIHTKMKPASADSKCEVCGNDFDNCTGSDNWRMADLAMEAVRKYAQESGEMTSDLQYRNDLSTIVRDLLGDLMHYCDREGVDFEHELEWAREHYRVEVEEELERDGELKDLPS